MINPLDMIGENQIEHALSRARMGTKISSQILSKTRSDPKNETLLSIFSFFNQSE